jgi:hypothetical protein
VAAGAIAALAYAPVMVYLALMPESATVPFGNPFIQVGPAGPTWEFNCWALLGGLLKATLGTTVAVSATAWLYNRLARNEESGSPPEGPIGSTLTTA